MRKSRFTESQIVAILIPISEASGRLVTTEPWSRFAGSHSKLSAQMTVFIFC
jgi:hypothetical protein